MATDSKQNIKVQENKRERVIVQTDEAELYLAL